MNKNSRRITKKEVEHVAWLAKIKLTEDEKNLFTEQFNSILEYFRVIDDATTEKIPPSFHAVALTDVLREDIIEPCLSREKALSNAPKKEKGFFKSPKIL